MAELDWTQAPVYLAPGGGRVIGYSDDPLYSTAGAAPKSDRYAPVPAYALQTPSFVAAGGGRVTGYADDPMYSSYGDVSSAKTNRGGNPILEQQQANAVAQALSLGRANGRAAGGGVAEALLAMSAPNQPRGSIVPGKSQDRIAAGYWAGEGGAWGGGKPAPSQALAAIEAVSPSSAVGLPRRRPNIEANPGTLVATRAPDTGGYGIPLSGGMNRGIAGRAGLGGIPGLSMAQAGGIGAQNRVLAGNLRAPVPITVRGGNRTQQALAQVAQAAQPTPATPAPVQPTVQATQWQQDRFQTTEGAGLPSSMGSTRWTTGY
jgi:hypothetical protein